ncbi:uncharacterized protein BO66DRAFT_71618 [Aspergillus aculeatinus CBS 121060]|uniref:Uncharacterized protein n=1 Tax=Aspergillus aculeatinus CBS 121060 TaxID=1448322 RepID=A0ACD1HNU6_9EURO|nr:hypothetical protein BO66DRAFT_71618 [Aspergillus aculeatinus CBS 121060]RAH75057.1 hypothetical protein BO66DRAFT_71618 [Aspergillus aculeatinus CBS 121060]
MLICRRRRMKQQNLTYVAVVKPGMSAVAYAVACFALSAAVAVMNREALDQSLDSPLGRQSVD